ncbi:MAG TPA: hypothetical protein DDW52_11830 [Planctomycetaceae bacterium]|nr:hypothetical protein [Planctomycetaceae bacterium]
MQLFVLDDQTYDRSAAFLSERVHPDEIATLLSGPAVGYLDDDRVVSLAVASEFGDCVRFFESQPTSLSTLFDELHRQSQSYVLSFDEDEVDLPQAIAATSAGFHRAHGSTTYTRYLGATS